MSFEPSLGLTIHPSKSLARTFARMHHALRELLPPAPQPGMLRVTDQHLSAQSRGPTRKLGLYDAREGGPG